MPGRCLPEVASTRMTIDRIVRWWPPAGVGLMLLLGVVVGKRSTALDDWFRHDVHDALGGWRRVLLVFVDPWLLFAVLASCLLVAVYRRRWRLALVIGVCSLVAVQLSRLLKLIFGRRIDDALSYPSGHTTALVVTMGMLVLVAGGRLWAVALAIVVSLLGMLGLSVTYHYFTDTVGAALFATAMVCLGASLAGRSRRSDRRRAASQPAREVPRLVVDESVTPLSREKP
jgi:membrane-associated phospholipid phosphatase